MGVLPGPVNLGSPVYAETFSTTYSAPQKITESTNGINYGEFVLTCSPDIWRRPERSHNRLMVVFRVYIRRSD
jgi:hypothetical protein